MDRTGLFPLGAALASICVGVGVVVVWFSSWLAYYDSCIHASWTIFISIHTSSAYTRYVATCSSTASRTAYVDDYQGACASSPAHDEYDMIRGMERD